jgi:hypothetical protein
MTHLPHSVETRNGFPPGRPHQANSPLRRVRATKAAVEKRLATLFNIVANMQPMTVRYLVGPVTLSGVS